MELKRSLIDKRSVKRKTGDSGEDIAAAWLFHHGYRIVVRNFYCKSGEIDIIAVDDEKRVLAFVEVKSRNSLNYGLPCQSVGIRKQQRLRRSAKFFLSANAYFRSCYQSRMDIIEILRLNDGVYLRHLENAF